MPNTKPFVAAAFICEKVLREDGEVYSAIRIVDTYSTKVVKMHGVSISGEDAEPPKSIDLSRVLDMSALVIVKAGSVSGKHEMSIVVRNPDGKKTPFPQKFPVDFKANDPAEGATLNIRFVMPGDAKSGLYWIDVLWDGEALTSIPLRLAKESESPETP
jgi:hypothetical protein